MDRLKPYLSKTQPEDSAHGEGPEHLIEAYSRYLWNIALCEALYPVLQTAEVTLRNTMHRELARQFGGEDWFTRTDIFHHPKHHDQVKQAQTKAIDKTKKHEYDLDACDLLPELSLGFWVALLDQTKYGRLFLNRALSKIFPNATPAQRDQVHRRYGEIRNLRNRVFHHEPIWHWNDLESRHNQVLDAITWMNKPARRLIQQQDRFDEVRRTELAVYRDHVRKAVGYIQPTEPSRDIRDESEG